MEDDEPCRTCGEPYDHYGDGWDGECPSCADKTFLAEEKPDEEPEIKLPDVPLALNAAQLATVQKWRQEWAEIINNPDEEIGGADCVDWCILFYHQLELLERDTR